jgi:hypothetical protein
MSLGMQAKARVERQRRSGGRLWVERRRTRCSQMPRSGHHLFSSARLAPTERNRFLCAEARVERLGRIR